ncbi:small cysteine and glycine repeat-containing protein 2-like [Ostrinia nubilalis]|uniref:small cysteine and glycine repeat-containing protein 2-like n=1 Tax=Ostrinia nubilalis TaxID=29057 RepID=UPI0030822C6F
MTSTKTVAFFAFALFLQCTWVHCQVIGGYPGGIYGGGYGNIIPSGCNDNADMDFLFPILLLSLFNRNNNNGGGCGCSGGCNGGCGGSCGGCGRYN